jgi:hypothetical protein
VTSNSDYFVKLPHANAAFGQHILRGADRLVRDVGLILIVEVIDRVRFYAARSGIGAWRFSPDRA